MLIRDIIPPKTKKRKRLFPKIITLLFIIILITPFFIGIKGSAAEFVATQRTTAGKFYPQLQVVGTKIYYVGSTSSASYQIWTAEMNVNGTGWSVTQRTSGGFDKMFPQLQVVGNKIYYVWSEWDNPNNGYQIWTAEMNTDGTGWSATQRTTTVSNELPQFQVVDTKIYYVWQKHDGVNYQLWTAEMNTDGTGWSAVKRTTSAFDKMSPQLQVVDADNKIYYVWQEDDGSGNTQIWTAEMNTDGTGWTATKRTTSAYVKELPQFQVVGTKIYYVWDEYDNTGYSQIWTAEMNTDGTGWTATKRTTNTYYNSYPQLQVMGDKIYYVGNWWDVNWQIWTAEMSISGTAWVYTTRTTGPFSNTETKFQVAGSRIYYVWYDDLNQIWTGEMGLDLPGISGLLPPPPEEVLPPPTEILPMIGKTIEEIKIEDILRQMINVLTQLNQSYSQLIQILKI